MFSGAHVILHSQDAEADRAFVRDVLGFAHVDAGHGWLLFKLPPAELAFHPTEAPPHSECYLMCDDLDAVLARLAEHGVRPVAPPTRQSWGTVTAIPLPSGYELPLYQPAHPVAHGL
ncbi:VOC family protein [Kitasatospora sp. NPDC002040]|uniref:VOC family protein n=1 Tax=Kitasatospora sp. NPDC002040 TaxID=3154661 RepID=UPI00332F6F7E